MKKIIFFCIFFCLTILASTGAVAQSKPGRKCLYINSYHKGYEWSDGIQEAALSALKNKCDVQVFYLDTKNNDSREYAEKKGLEAKAWIEGQKADLVIVADDPAVEFVLKDHFKNKELPFVFCGINWEASKYGLPYKNATGMIEVAPVEDLVKYIQEIAPSAKSAMYLSGDVASLRGNFNSHKIVYDKRNLKVKATYAKNMADWEKKFIKAQAADVVILANNAGIEDWSYEKAQAIIREHGKKFSVTYQEYMRNLTAFSLTKLPEEQGEWAGKVAIEILNGARPSEIPVAVNRRWNIYVNEDVTKLNQIKIPEVIARRASKVTFK